MILPGFPMPMISKSGAAPFDISGSWENNADGWNLNVAGSGFINNIMQPRTGSFSINRLATSILQSQSGTASFTIPKEQCSGLKIIASVWHKHTDDGTENAFRQIMIGLSDNTTATQWVNDAVTTYAYMETEIVNTTNGDVTVFIHATANWGAFNQGAVFDDWRIQGVKP